MQEIHNEDSALIDQRLDPRLTARNLYWQGWKITAIAQHLGLKPATVHSWKLRGNWDGGTPVQRIQASAEARLIQLINLPRKSDGVYKEIKQLSTLITKQEKSADAPLGVTMPDRLPEALPQEVSKSGGRAKKPEKNFFTPAQLERVQEIFFDQMFAYQRAWYDIGKKVRFRNLIKSRQIGATYFFAREALIDALITGKNKVFLSASRAQAFQFKQYMVDLAAMVDVELKGDKIVLANSGAVLNFLGTNSRTAQGRNGDLYVDEYFWIPDFAQLSKLAKPMASQKQYRITYFSTPSFKSHEAYGFWSGERFNDGRPAGKHIHLDVSHAALQRGRADPDGQWRQIVTLDDAEAGGCTLFDQAQLKLEYSPNEFRQLFMCEFMEDCDAVFDYALLKKSWVDTWEAWEAFYKPLAPRPVGQMAVWVGFDPSGDGDAAGLVVVLPPQKTGEPFRVLEHQLLRGNDFQAQAAAIKALMERYTVGKIVMDSTGVGAAVFELVQKFFPQVQGLRYTAELKVLMVHKALDLFRHGRVQWDAADKAMSVSFMGIRRQMTSSGRNVTYVADRSAAASHCDLAWAAMMVFYQEPFDGRIGSGSSLEIV